MSLYTVCRETDPLDYSVVEETSVPLLALTPEQTAIIRSTGNISINAVAGSGKTTTIIEYARTRPPGSRILYLAFNRTVRQEAAKKLAARGLCNVQVETAHSLAYKYTVLQHRYTVRGQGYRTHEIVDLLRLRNGGERHIEYIIANHINRFLTYFCNSDKRQVRDLAYGDTLTDEKARAFAQAFYPLIEKGTRALLSKMNNGEIEVLHDFYLKKFQLQSPVLPYDYILFDEAQDASAAMLDVVLKQKATKVIVGDAHQQIYGWRFAVNSLQRAGFSTYPLSTSFRFGPDIAQLATRVLGWKGHLSEHQPVAITGAGRPAAEGSRAIIGRTNLGLLSRAIEYLTKHPGARNLYFEGNISSYTYAEDGTSLYDVLYLYNGKHHKIRDKLVGSMQDLDDLEDYIDKTGDMQLAMMAEIVREFGNDIPRYIRLLKDKHLQGDDKHQAEMIFSTVHRCKGMEYDAIQLVNDFVTEARLEKLKAEGPKGEDRLLAKWNEEINLLYVAITRTRGSIRIPGALLPRDLPASPLIRVLQAKKEEGKNGKPVGASPLPRYTGMIRQAPVAERRDGHERPTPKSKRGNGDAYQPWTPEADEELRQLYAEGARLVAIARHFGRTPGAIIARLRKLGQ